MNKYEEIMKNTDAVLFDMDGTLIDSMWVWATAVSYTHLDVYKRQLHFCKTKREKRQITAVQKESFAS